MSDGYNGWKNWETWNAYNWLSSDPGTWDYYRGMVWDYHREEVTADNPADVYQAAEVLREAFVDNLPDLPPGWALDAILGALDAVDWQEVAAALLED
jgi:hypothetical protein